MKQNNLNNDMRDKDENHMNKSINNNINNNINNSIDIDIRRKNTISNNIINSKYFNNQENPIN
jgi:hypothetical protein